MVGFSPKDFKIRHRTRKTWEHFKETSKNSKRKYLFKKFVWHLKSLKIQPVKQKQQETLSEALSLAFERIRDKNILEKLTK